jgi:hypothetical protein
MRNETGDKTGLRSRFEVRLIFQQRTFEDQKAEEARMKLLEDVENDKRKLKVNKWRKGNCYRRTGFCLKEYEGS